MSRFKYKDPNTGEFIPVATKEEVDSFKSAYAPRLTTVEEQINNLDAEVTDAHNSIVKNKNFASLKARLEESEQDLETHKSAFVNHLIDPMPHQAKDLQNTKTFRFGLQMSVNGNPQIIFEEVI
jgi:hypothetical protein